MTLGAGEIGMEEAVRGLAEQLEPLERLVGLYSASLDQPRLAPSGDGRSFRYGRPDIRHFCLLKAVLALNTLFASFELARKGYIFQVEALLRIVIESTTHIEFVLDPTTAAQHRAKVDEYIRLYFADYERDPGAPFQKPPISQRLVNDTIGKTLDEIASQFEELEGRKPAARAYSSIFRAFSNFVHGRYPESVDLYGGTPGHFHLHGMSGTRKDMEMVETLKPIVGTVSNVFAHMVQGLRLERFVEADPIIARWYHGRIGSPHA